jgi:hypothetical protein
MQGAAYGSMLDSGFVSFKLNYSETKDIAIGAVVHSDAISVGGHSWRVNCYPRGYSEADKGEYITIFLELMTGAGLAQVKGIQLNTLYFCQSIYIYVVYAVACMHV